MFRPEPEFLQVPDQVLIDHDKLTGECSTQVDVRRIGLETLVIAHDLGRGCGRHGRHQKRVA